MKTNYVKLSLSMLMIGAAALFQSCSKSSDAVGNGDAEFQITDAPSDDANIKGVFVTVADIKVDGKSVSGFTKQTIDLKAYQEGSTKVLGTSKLAAKGYSNVVLVLDTDTDASGSTPGCYVQTIDNAKYKLKSGGTVTVTANKAWNVAANSKSTIIIDFDIRKAIRQMSDQSVRYNFVSDANLNAAVRVVDQSSSGTINGTYTEQVNTNADKIFVYAYKKGTFVAATETQAQGDDAITFKNAISSAEVKGAATKTYKLTFLESGEYEFHFASYKKDVNDHYVFQAHLQSNTTASGSAGNIINITAGINLGVNSTVTGL